VKKCGGEKQRLSHLHRRDINRTRGPTFYRTVRSAPLSAVLVSRIFEVRPKSVGCWLAWHALSRILNSSVLYTIDLQ